MNSREALKWAFAVVRLVNIQTRLAALKRMASGQDIDDIDILEHTAEFVRAHSDAQSQENMPSETCKRLVAAVDELSDLLFECFRALALTREPLVDVLAEWYAHDNFGRSDCARLQALMG